MFTEIVKNDNGKMIMTDLDILAESINSEYALCYQAMIKGAEHALRVGELLLQAKSLVDHGDWYGWVVDNCDFTSRTASNYMLLARNKEIFKTETVSDLSMRGMLDMVHTETIKTKVAVIESPEVVAFSWEKDEEVIKAREVFSNLNNTIDRLKKDERDPGMAKAILKQFAEYMTNDFLNRINPKWKEEVIAEAALKRAQPSE